MRALGRTVWLAAGLWAGIAGAASAATVSGVLSGTPTPGPRTIVVVKALSMRDASVAGAVSPRGGRWSMSLRPGVYLILALVDDVNARRAYVADRRLVGVGQPAARSAASTGVVGLGDIPINVNDGSGPVKVGNGSNQVLLGLLPVCDKKREPVADRTKVATDAVKTEQQLSDEGRTAYKINVQPLQPTEVISGSVTINTADRNATSDLQITDGRTGRLIKHVVVRDDSGDLDGFLERLGNGVGNFACPPAPGRPQPKKKNKPPSRGAKGPIYIRLQLTENYDAASNGNSMSSKTSEDVVVQITAADLGRGQTVSGAPLIRSSSLSAETVSGSGTCTWTGRLSNGSGGPLGMYKVGRKLFGGYPWPGFLGVAWDETSTGGATSNCPSRASFNPLFAGRPTSTIEFTQFGDGLSDMDHFDNAIFPLTNAATRSQVFNVTLKSDTKFSAQETYTTRASGRISISRGRCPDGLRRC